MFGWAPPFPLPAPAWELYLIGNQCDNTQSKLQTFKLTSLSSTWVNSNIYNFDRVLSHWFPIRKRSHPGAGRKIRQWRSRGKGGAQLNTNTILGQVLILGTFTLPSLYIMYTFWSFRTVTFFFNKICGPCSIWGSL